MTRHFDKAILAKTTSVAGSIISELSKHPAKRWTNVRIGLVNNMPDGALAATEQQFTELVSKATNGRVKLELYYLPSLPRSTAAAAILAEKYRPISDLYLRGIDALIVTGNEPRAPRLDQESYWNDLTTLIDWASENTQSTFWSCLAAHAAVLHLDRIERHRLPAKRSGVYSCDTSFDPNKMTGSFVMCHSRLNDVPAAVLEKSGYRILSRNSTGDVDAFTKSVPSRFLFLQGHPEYDSLSLAREYRRDVERYLNGTRDEYPAMPENYFNSASSKLFEEFRGKAEILRKPELIANFPEPGLRDGLASDLANSAASIFGFWMTQVLDSKAEMAVAV